jgi:hypothetical protein
LRRRSAPGPRGRPGSRRDRAPSTYVATPPHPADRSWRGATAGRREYWRHRVSGYQCRGRTVTDVAKIRHTPPRSRTEPGSSGRAGPPLASVLRAISASSPAGC